MGDGFFFFHKGWCLVFFFNKVVFTFFQTKELNEVFLGNWFRTGVGGERPFPSWLLVLDDVGVCHIMSVFEYTYIDTAITPELGYNQLIRHKKSNCQMGFTTAVAVANPLCSKTLVFKKSETPLWFVIFTETPPCSWVR